jgi:DNA adenine methylase
LVWDKGVGRRKGHVAASPLKWAGGKRWQAPHLREYWAGNETRRLVEPFCGGLAVTLGLSPERALANDINASLINFHRWLQRGLTVDVEMENEEALYYSLHRRKHEPARAGSSPPARAPAANAVRPA